MVECTFAKGVHMVEDSEGTEYSNHVVGTVFPSCGFHLMTHATCLRITC